MNGDSQRSEFIMLWGNVCVQCDDENEWIYDDEKTSQESKREKKLNNKRNDK